MNIQPTMTEQNLPNGLPPSLVKPNLMPSPISFNGVDSSHSSRTSSPANRLQQIPASQLPPARNAIPASQLPPSGMQPVNQLTQNYAQLNIRQHVTPISSPKVQNFSTSTPVTDSVKTEETKPSSTANNFSQNREFSPIAQTSSQNNFTHSAQSCFTNVPSGNSVSTQNKPDPVQFQNVPLGSDVSYSNNHNNNASNQKKAELPSNSMLINNHRLNNDHSAQSNQLKSGYSNDVQITGQGHHVSAQQTTGSYSQTQSQSKIQQSASQPLFNVPLSVQQQPQVQQATKPLQSYNSTPNLHQNALQNSGGTAQQNAAFGGTNSPYFGGNVPFSVGNMQQSTVQQKMPQISSSQFQAGPPRPQAGPSLSQAAPPLSQAVPPLSQAVPPLLQTGHPQSQTGPPQSQAGPPQSHVGPAQPQAGPPQPQMGPAHLQTRPPQPQGLPQNFSHVQKVPQPQQGSGNFQQRPEIGLQQRPPEVGLQHIQPSFPPQKTEPNPPLSNVPLQPPPTSQASRANLHANRYPTATKPPAFQTSQQNTYQTSQQNTYQTSQPNTYQTSQQNAYQTVESNQNQNQFNYQNQRQSYNQNQQYNQGNVMHGGFNKAWGNDNYDLLQCPNILPPIKVEPPRVTLGQEFLDAANCSPDIFRCTVTKIPETGSLLQKSRLPLGILIHPFKDLDHLPVIQCSTIVRCRACRTYINPFVFFVDMKRWKCNLCYRVNELPEEFQFDPVSKTYGDPSRRPEIKSSTIEYIAPSEYMLRPPQPAVYLFLLDVSHAAVESGYLHTFCNVVTSNLSSLPGDSRTQIGFIAYNSALHFYSLAEGLNQPHEMTVLDIDDVFLPCPENLIVNLQERKELITDLLAQLPTRFSSSFDTGSALGAALQAAHKMILSTGGRITVFQATLPSVGPGALKPREDPSQRASAEVQHLNPANDFYKRMALECSGHQIAVDLFVVNSQYVDLATISGISRFSGGCMHHFPLFNASRTLSAESLERCLKRYLARKIGFEAVMRIRCTRGLSIHTFHGNFFVRSTDLLSLPNVNPEAGFGMQVAIDESLSDLHTVCFQAALLYTSSKGERRIRVHTLCVPVASNLSDVINSADQQCIVGLLAKMAVDRSMQTSLSDAREAFINVAIDILSSYKLSLNLGSGPAGLLAPNCLKLLPLYISALLKHVAFRTGTSTRLDDRIKAMCDMKTLPLYLLIQQIYPDLYPVHNLEDQNTTLNIEGEEIPQPPHLQLSARSLDSKGAFLMDMGEQMVLLVCAGVSQVFLKEALGVPDYNSITEQMYDLPILNTPSNQRLNNFINYLNEEKPFAASLHIIRENSSHRSVFIERLIEDRIETALSYHEFLQHLKTQVK